MGLAGTCQAELLDTKKPSRTAAVLEEECANNIFDTTPAARSCERIV